MPRSMSLYKKLAPAQDLNEFDKIAEDLDSMIVCINLMIQVSYI